VLIGNGMKRGGTDIGLYVTRSGLFVIILGICLFNFYNMIKGLKEYAV
jgi:hypothetical protein